MRAPLVSSKKRVSRPAPSDGPRWVRTTGASSAARPTASALGVDDEAAVSACWQPRPAATSAAASASASVARTSMPVPASSSSREPSATILPLPMISSWSATASTSISRWLESRTVPPRSAKSRSSPRIQRMPSGSRPLAGSSRISTSGSPSSACASPSRWRMPSEYCRTRLPAAHLSSPTSVSSSSTRVCGDAHHLRRDGQRLAAAAAGVLGGGVEQHADAAARVRQLAVVARRARRESPASGVGEADQHPHRRGLAGAVGPRKPVTVPGSQRNETSLTTARPPRRFVSPVASIMARSIGARRPCRTTAARSMPGSTSVGGRPRPRAYIARRCDARWHMLPGGLLEEPGAKRTARDWIVDVMMSVVALGDRRARASRATEDQHSDGMASSTSSSAWSRCDDAVVAAALAGRRGDHRLVVSAVSAFAAGAGADGAVQRRAARLRRAIVGVTRSGSRRDVYMGVYPDDEVPVDDRGPDRRS